jgi:DNA polymerase-3 subunit epsilon
MRHIILDTETTGLKVEEGHRLIEIGCLEMIDRKLTDKRFHTYLNPLREVDAGALQVHGISNEFLNDKPLFNDVVNEFMTFIAGATVIIHNAPFDLGFLDQELTLAKSKWKKVTEHCDIIDTLQLARTLHAGQRNNLDALCKRYKIDNSKRDFHGALLDAYLLAQVYLAMTGGQGSLFEAPDALMPAQTEEQRERSISLAQHHLVIMRASLAEGELHDKYMEVLEKK